jgi:hypothetical protein
MSAGCHSHPKTTNTDHNSHHKNWNHSPLQHADQQAQANKIEEHNIHKLVHFESKGIPLSFKSSTCINPIVASSPVQKKEVLVKGLELATRAVQTA